MDVLSAFLNSTIKEEVYMEEPKGFQKGKNRELVCGLKKSIYGLHQSGRDWSMFITDKLKEQNFKRCINEPCIFYKEDMLLGLYEDDLLCVGKREEIENFIKKFSKEVEFRNLGEVKNILFLGVKKKDGGLLVSQEPYATQLLEQYAVKKHNVATSPLPINIDNEENNELPIDN